jgi:hypothetical protein
MDQLVGKWRWRDSGRTIEFDLKPDGTFKARDYPDKVPPLLEGGGFVKDGKGTWEVEGGRLTVKMTHVWAVLWIPHEVTWIDRADITSISEGEVRLGFAGEFSRCG